MYSSEDFERFYFQYKTEALPLGMSIETFCLKNKVPYNIFSKWYQYTRKKVYFLSISRNLIIFILFMKKRHKMGRFYNKSVIFAHSNEL